MLAVRIQAIDGARTCTLLDSQYCRLLPSRVVPTAASSLAGQLRRLHPSRTCIRCLCTHRICYPPHYRKLAERGLSPRKIHSIVDCSSHFWGSLQPATVAKPLRFGAMELCLSHKQMPQVIGLIGSRQNQGERLERACAPKASALPALRYAPT